MITKNDSNAQPLPSRNTTANSVIGFVRDVYMGSTGVTELNIKLHRHIGGTRNMNRK